MIMETTILPQFMFHDRRSSLPHQHADRRRSAGLRRRDNSNRKSANASDQSNQNSARDYFTTSKGYIADGLSET